MKRLWDAANAALDVIDAEIAQGPPNHDWTAQLREVIALIDEPSLEQDDCSPSLDQKKKLVFSAKRRNT
ncbi:hypothetical protein QM042_02400 [Escherichia coli]|uniref:hypothetical protein n=1 Tax=Escherichia coli TaxID=562 RepID=UPI00398605F2